MGILRFDMKDAMLACETGSLLRDFSVHKRHKKAPEYRRLFCLHVAASLQTQHVFALLVDDVYWDAGGG